MIYDDEEQSILEARNKERFLTPFLGKANSRILLNSFPTLNEIAKLTDTQIKRKLPKISQRKIDLLKAAFKLSSEFNQETVPLGLPINSAEDLANLVREKFRFSRNEKLLAVYLNAEFRVIEIRSIAEGTPGEVVASPRQIFEPALENGATHVAVAHNHPGCYAGPSQADEEAAKALRQAGEALEITLYDEIIIGTKMAPRLRDYHSMVEDGVLPSIRDDDLFPTPE